MEDKLLNQNQAAQLIGYTREAIRQAIAAGRLRATRYGPALLIRESDLWLYRDLSEHNPDMEKRNPKYRIYPGGKGEKRRLAKHPQNIIPS